MSKGRISGIGQYGRGFFLRCPLSICPVLGFCADTGVGPDANLAPDTVTWQRLGIRSLGHILEGTERDTELTGGDMPQRPGP